LNILTTEQLIPGEKLTYLIFIMEKDVTGHQGKTEVGVHPHHEHFEGEPEPGEKQDEAEVILKSSLDDLNLWTTVKRFKKVTYNGASPTLR
jgi:hypothetical protein